MSDWATAKAREWLHDFPIIVAQQKALGMTPPESVTSLAALLDEVTIERVVERDNAEVGFKTMRDERDAARAERDDLEASWRIERASSEVAFRTLLAERAQAAAQASVPPDGVAPESYAMGFAAGEAECDRLRSWVSALREALKKCRAVATGGYSPKHVASKCESLVAAALADTQAAAEAHDREVRESAIANLKESAKRSHESGFRAGLERAAQECDKQADEYDTAARTAFQRETALQAESCQATCEYLADAIRGVEEKP